MTAIHKQTGERFKVKKIYGGIITIYVEPKHIKSFNMIIDTAIVYLENYDLEA